MGGKRKTAKVGTEVMSQRRLSEEKEKPVKLLTEISSLSLDGISKKRIPEESPNPYARPRRKCVQGSRSSGEKVDSASLRRKYVQGSRSSDEKVDSASSSSRGQSKRVCNATSVLRRPLHDSLFDRCFQNIWRESPEERRNQFIYLNCFWFHMYVKESYREKVLGWIKKQDIFSRRYVLVPIVLWSHWSLLIFCHLGESLESKTRTPCMLLLDSLRSYGAPSRLEPLIRRLVLDIV